MTSRRPLWAVLEESSHPNQELLILWLGTISLSRSLIYQYIQRRRRSKIWSNHVYLTTDRKWKSKDMDNPLAFVVACIVSTMGDDTNPIEKKIQFWSFRGINSICILFFILSLALMCISITNTSDISGFDLSFTVLLLIGILIGIVDKVRTSVYFVYIWIAIGLLSVLLSIIWFYYHTLTSVRSAMIL